MQALYAYNANPKANVSSAETDLLKSVRSCYALFLWLFALLPEIAFYRTKKLDSLKEKYGLLEFPKTYLPKEYDYLICDVGDSFDAKGEDVMSHGGISMDECIVPFIMMKAEENYG